MRKLATTLAVVGALLLSAGSAWADYHDGMAAYERGDHATGFRETQPLAEQGHAGAQYKVDYLESMLIKAIGHQWYWTYEYPDLGEDISFDSWILYIDELEGEPYPLAVDERLVVPLDTPIRLQVTSYDVKHIWNVPELGVSIDAIPGQLSETMFRANKEGIYYGALNREFIRCEYYQYMPISVEVVSKEAYTEWVEYAKSEFNGSGPYDEYLSQAWVKRSKEARKNRTNQQSDEISAKISSGNRLAKLEAGFGAEHPIVALAERGAVDAQFALATCYEEGSEQFKKSIPTAIDWARKSYEGGYDDAKELYDRLHMIAKDRLLLQEFVFASDVRTLRSIAESVRTTCTGEYAIKCAFDQLWKYIDVTGDQHLSQAEIARFQRNIVKFVAVEQEDEELKTEDIAAINLASIMLTPVTAAAILGSFDYDNDGQLSKNEVMSDEAFAEMLGLDSDDVGNAIDFESLGQRLRDALNQLPFFKQ